MEEVAQVRRASRAALGDIEPDALRRHVDELVVDGTMLPGVLVLLSARSLEPSVDPTLVEDRIAGVQLVYTGLHLTRRLIHEEPWARLEDGEPGVAVDVAADGNGTDGVEADGDGYLEPNLDVLAADVLVSRGFYLLARTEAAPRAVETVRAFGRDQTHRREPDADRRSLDRNLEIDIFELAAISGAGALDRRPPEWLREATVELAFMVDMPEDDGAGLGKEANVYDLIHRLGEPTLQRAVRGGSDETISQSATDP